MQLTTDLSGLGAEVRGALIKRLQHADQARYALGIIEQRRMKQHHDSAGIGTYKSEIGPARMVLSGAPQERQKFWRALTAAPQLRQRLRRLAPQFSQNCASPALRNLHSRHALAPLSGIGSSPARIVRPTARKRS